MKKLACAAALVAASCAVSAAPEIVNLGLPPGESFAIAYAVTPAGDAAVVQAGTRSYLWTEADGYTLIPALAGGNLVLAYDLSADGTTVVGVSNNKPFLWTAKTGSVALPTFFPGGAGTAYAVSADGSTVVGESSSRAMRWTTTETGEALVNPFPANFAWALGCDADADTAVGIVAIESGATRAMRWTEQGGMESLGVIAGANFSRAHAVSADGLVVTGYSQSPSPVGPKMFRWTAETGLVNLGTVVGSSSFGHSINGDGSIIVGDSGGGAVWSEPTGIVSLRDYLTLNSVPAVEDWGFFNSVQDITADSNALAGSANLIGESVILPIIVRGLAAEKPCTGDSNGDNIVNFADLNAVLADFGQTGAPGTIPGDLNGDGVVNFADLNTVLANFGSECAG